MSDFVYMLAVGVATAVVLLSFALVIFFFLRENRLRSMAPAHAHTDLTNMMILFQTMRDILAQQKDLAREFNISIDQKVSDFHPWREGLGRAGDNGAGSRAIG